MVDSHENSDLSSTAVVKLVTKEQTFEEGAMGDGSVDAAYKAIERIVGNTFSLENDSIRSVSGGEDVLGEKAITGRGLSTDIIESGILTYLNGVNKFFVNNF